MCASKKFRINNHQVKTCLNIRTKDLCRIETDNPKYFATVNISDNRQLHTKQQKYNIYIFQYINNYFPSIELDLYNILIKLQTRPNEYEITI